MIGMNESTRVCSVKEGERCVLKSNAFRGLFLTSLISFFSVVRIHSENWLQEITKWSIFFRTGLIYQLIGKNELNLLHATQSIFLSLIDTYFTCIELLKN